MKTLWILTKVLFHSLQDMFSVSTNSRKKPIHPVLKWGLIALLVGLIYVSIILPIGYVGYVIADALGNFSSLVVYGILLMGSLALVVFSLFTILSQFYLSSDNALLLPLPIKPWQIVAARFMLTIATLFLIEAVFILPFLIGYAWAVQATLDIYVYIGVTLILLPILPVSVMTLVISVAMRGSPLIKNKDSFVYAVTFLALGVSMGISFGFQYILTMVEENPDVLAGNFASIVMIFKTYTPFLIPFYTMLTDYDGGMRFGYLLVTLIMQGSIFVVTTWIVSLVYIKGLMSGGENPSKKKPLSAQEGRSMVKGSHPLIAYIVKEWRLMARSPIYFLNLIFVTLLMPVILILSFSSTAFAASDPDLEMIANLLKTFRLDFNNGAHVTGFLGIILFFAGTSMISATAISREGKNAWFMKMIPMAAYEQIHAKMAWGLIMSLFTYISVSIIPLYLGNVGWFDWAILLILFMLIQIASNYVGIGIDLRRPKLTWDSEAAAVKNNLNGVFYMLIEFALGGIMVGFMFLINANQWQVSGPLLYLGLFVAFGLFDFVLYRYVRSHSESLLERI